MDSSIFNSQFQMAIYQLIFKLLERASGEVSPASGAANQSGQLSEASIASSDAGRPGKFEELIQKAAARHNVDPRLVKAVIQAESAFNPDAVSSAGAQGLMQLMPATAEGLGVEDPLDPRQNINGGVKLLSQLLNRYDEDLSLALAAYNAGPGAVKRFGGIPPYQETQTYVKRVLGYYKSEKDWSG
jgi:soluble lytic murein transglycosylase-like protein